MRYEFIEAHQKQYRIHRLCKVLKVSRSGYYGYLKQQKSEREKANEQLLEDIKTIYEQSKQT